MTALPTRGLPGRGLVLLALLCWPGAAAGPALGSDPWGVLAEVRDQLREASPLEAGFTQTFVPGGFATGDTESGILYVDLPRCLRFEYREPFPKDFLLCGDWVYTWNPGEPSGRRFLVNDSEAEGLDLLRLEVDLLRTRYRAELGSDGKGRTAVRLVPKDASADIREATLEIGQIGESTPSADGSATSRLLVLAYEDHSGNQTRFEITDYKMLAAETHFQPPALDWLED